MFQFFVGDSQVLDGKVVIEGNDVNHMKNVLRMKEGEKIRISTPGGQGYFCQIETIGVETIEAKITGTDAVGTELPCKVYLFQGLPKGDKMELVIQKSVELGVCEVIPVAMKNCVVKLDEKKAGSKVKRWQAIAESAAKQSKRSMIPMVHSVMSYKEAVSYAKTMDIQLVPYENEEGMAATKRAFEQMEPGKSIAVFIGPEGGFDTAEIELVKDSMQLISLGRRILRTETAGLTTLSILMYHLELKVEEQNRK